MGWPIALLPTPLTDAIGGSALGGGSIELGLGSDGGHRCGGRLGRERRVLEDVNREAPRRVGEELRVLLLYRPLIRRKKGSTYSRSASSVESK